MPTTVTRVILIVIAVNINIFDSILNYKRTKGTLGPIGTRFHNLMIFYYFLLICFFIGVKVYFANKEQPDISVLNYVEADETWYKYLINYTIDTPPSYCSKTSLSDSLYNTVDFAMMTTLPRLYGVTKDKKCYIKPNKRGVFNSTMKYIFGKNYEDDNINIYCFPYSHNPYLVITSEKLLEDTITKYYNISEYLINK